MMKLEILRLEKEIIMRPVDFSKQRELDADPQAIQQIEFIGILKARSNVFTILEKSKETILEFYKGTAKVM